MLLFGTRGLMWPCLTTRSADCLDFHETAVWQLRKALAAAYRAGAESTRASR